MRSRAASFLLVLSLGAVAAPPVLGSWSVVDGGAGEDGRVLVERSCVQMTKGRWRLEVLSETASADTALTAAHDSWTGFDKVQHTTFSLLWVLGSQYVLVNKAKWGERTALPYSVSLTATLGVAKELYDWRISSSRYFSRRDLVANLVGIAAGVVIIIL